jgi:uncharacterized protein
MTGLLRFFGVAVLALVFVASNAYGGIADAQRALQRGDYEAAARLVPPLAEQGNREAQFLLGQMHRAGHGVPLSYPDALVWLRRAASQGEPRAQHELGMMYGNGQGVAKDEVEAMRWFRLAADQRNASAMATLGRSYELGRSVPKDLVQAYMWYDLAIRNARGSDRVTQMNEARQQVANLLGPGDLARARQLALAWAPQSTLPATASPAQPPVQVAAPPPREPPRSPAKTTSTGSGFVVNRSGHVLTNDHVVDDCRELRAGTSGEVLASARIVARDQRNDLALLKLGAPLTAWAVFRDGRSIRAGDSVVAIGYPLRGLLASSAHVTTGTVSALAGTLDDSRILQTTAPVQAGNSGGPLLDQNGHVVGVVVGKLDALKVAKVTGDLPQNVGFALTASIARSFMDGHGIDYDTAPSVKILSPADVADRARRFTVIIECAQ